MGIVKNYFIVFLGVLNARYGVDILLILDFNINI